LPGKRRSGVARVEQRRAQLLSALPDLQQVLRGTLVTRYRKCGRPSCHCAEPQDPGHGPAYYLMVTTRPGRTLQIYVPRKHKREVETWIRNFQRTRKTLEAISTLNRALLRQGTLFEANSE
jgi:hypothetical protein